MRLFADDSVLYRPMLNPDDLKYIIKNYKNIVSNVVNSYPALAAFHAMYNNDSLSLGNDNLRKIQNSLSRGLRQQTEEYLKLL